MSETPWMPTLGFVRMYRAPGAPRSGLAIGGGLIESMLDDVAKRH